MCAWTIERWYWEQNARICIVQTCGGRITSISCAKLINITTIFIYGLNIHIETRCHYGYYTITIIVLKSSCSLWPLFHTLQRVPISKNVESACGNLFPHIKQITFSILFGSHALRLHLIESAQNNTHSCTHTHHTDYNTIQYNICMDFIDSLLTDMNLVSRIDTFNSRPRCQHFFLFFFSNTHCACLIQKIHFFSICFFSP